MAGSSVLDCINLSMKRCQDVSRVGGVHALMHVSCAGHCLLDHARDLSHVGLRGHAVRFGLLCFTSDFDFFRRLAVCHSVRHHWNHGACRSLCQFVAHSMLGFTFYCCLVIYHSVSYHRNLGAFRPTDSICRFASLPIFPFKFCRCLAIYRSVCYRDRDEYLLFC